MQCDGPKTLFETNPPRAEPTASVNRSPEQEVKRSPVIQVRGLTRVYRTYKKQPGFAGALRGLLYRRFENTFAARDVSFDIMEGELVGFLGPNGAGKTTTLKMLAGLLYPTAGSATILGYVPWMRDSRYQRQFALLLGQKNQLWWDLPARDSLELNSKIYGISSRAFNETLDELSHMLQVTEKLDVMVRELSLGERMKLELIAALLHKPKVLFLDEPTIGLDVISQQTVREFLRAYNKTHKTTILITSHYMADIEALCRRVIIMDRGRIFFDGLWNEVLERFAEFKFIDVVTANQSLETPLADFPSTCQIVEQTPGHIKFKVPRNEVAAACKMLLERLAITDIRIQDVPVEEVIRNVFRGRSSNESSRLPLPAQALNLVSQALS